MSAILSLWHLPQPTVRVQGLAMSTSSQLLRVQADRKERLYRLHAGRVCCLSGPQCARTAAPGMETLLPETVLLCKG